MPQFEHASTVGTWQYKSLWESAKFRQMAYNEEAAHRNKANSRFQNETRWTASAPENYANFDNAFVLILQGVHAIVDEASSPVGVVNAYIKYPTGVGLAPYLRRPIPIVQGLRSVFFPFPGTPTIANTAYRDVAFGAHEDAHPTAEFEAMPEASVGVTGIDASTDFKTSLVIAHRWSNNTPSVGEVHKGGYLFWRVIGHVAAYGV